MGGIFINYRRGEHNGVVSMLGCRLATHFGDEQVFLDIRSISPGARYPEVLERRLLECEVVLVVIHERWLTERNEKGTWRLGDKDDWVCRELKLALRNGKKIVPILLDHALAPRANDLPEPIRDLADRQAHRICTSSYDVDVEELISQLEGDIAPTWTPSDDLEAKSSRKPGRWLAALTAVLALLLFAGPPALVLDTAPPAPGEVPVALQLALWSLLLMWAPFVGALVIAVFRSSINSVERDLSRTSAHWYHKRTAFPLAIVVLAIPLVVNIFLDNGLGILISLLVVALGLLYSGRQMARIEKNEDELRKNWSYRLPGAPQPAVLRQGVTLLDDQLKGWARPLSKERRERATYMLDALDSGARAMRETAERGRWCWLADRPWWVAGYTLWVSITVGLVVATAVPALLTGRAWWHTCLVTVMLLLVCGTLSGGTTELVYRQNRWRGRAVATDVIESVGKLRQYLNDLVAGSAVY